MTASVSTDELISFAGEPGMPFSSLVRIDVSAQSHTGHLRAANEDHFAVMRLGRTLETLITSVSAADVPTHGLVGYVIVVDGMGGHSRRIASRMAISRSSAWPLGMPDWIFRVDQAHAARSAAVPPARSGSRRVLVERGRRDGRCPEWGR
jgi:hypothetical protein